MPRNIENRISKQMLDMPPPPPWVEEIQAKHPDLYLCHMQNKELKALDTMQGGPSIDETTGIREYSKLDKIIEDPKVLKVFQTVFEDLIDDGKLSPDLENYYKEGQKLTLPYRETPAEEQNPINSIEKTGEGGDTKLAFLPKNVVFFLLDLRGGKPSFNSKTGLLEFWGSFIPTLLDIGSSILGFMGAEDEADDERAYQERQRQLLEAEKQRMGYYDPFEYTPLNRKLNPNYNPSEDDKAHGRFQPFYAEEPGNYAQGGHVLQSFSEGSMIKGPGKGQQDKIHTHVPANSYIIDATSVAHFGDGSSERGAETLKEFEHRVKASHPNVVRQITEQIIKEGQQTPVFLSNDEYKFDPVTVHLLGKGSPEKGSQQLKNMVKNLRKDKARNGLGLPPPAKDPFQYMRGVK
jgi:hypothetical protein